MGSLLTRYTLWLWHYTATAVKLGTSEGSYKLGHCGLHRCQWGVYSPDTLYDFGIIRRQPSSLWLPKEVTSLFTADYIDANGKLTHQIHFVPSSSVVPCRILYCFLLRLQPSEQPHEHDHCRCRQYQLCRKLRVSQPIQREQCIQYKQRRNFQHK